MLSDNTRLLSNAELYNLMKTNKHISEEGIRNFYLRENQDFRRRNDKNIKD
jgi:hypothetical protein